MSATAEADNCVTGVFDPVTAHRTMVTIREFEELALRKQNEGVLHGSLHLSVGMEAIAAGVFPSIRRGDYFATTHRNHGHTIACGSSLIAMFAELFGREGGLCAGKGGSMHMADAEHGHMGGTGIVGASIHLAAGAALTAQVRRTGGIGVAFFGDGAANRGHFHEGLNMAALWKLPAVFVCENNAFGQWTRHEDASSVATVAERAMAYGIPGVRVDGNDVAAVAESFATAAARARDGEGPTLLEYVTYRLRDHHGGRDQRKYRERSEIDEWRTRDPISRNRDRIITGGLRTAGEVTALERKVADEVRTACSIAETRPTLDPRMALDDIVG